MASRAEQTVRRVRRELMAPRGPGAGREGWEEGEGRSQLREGGGARHQLVYVLEEKSAPSAIDETYLDSSPR